MKRLAAITSMSLALALSLAPAAHAADLATVTSGGMTVTAVGNWKAPTSCSSYPLAYTGMVEDGMYMLQILDADSRTVLGMASGVSGMPNAGQVTVQMCSFQVTPATRMLLSLEVFRQGVVESAPFTWNVAPTYTSKPTPKGWACRAVPATATTQTCIIRTMQREPNARIAVHAAKGSASLQAAMASIPMPPVKAVVKKVAGGYRVTLTLTYARDPA
jgi:hypothetical protein